MLKKITLITSLTLLLSACGGGGGSGDNNSNPSEPSTADKKYDLSKYLVRKKGTNESALHTEFYRMEYFYEDGTKAWFDFKGMPSTELTSEPEYASDGTFSSIKFMKTLVDTGDLVEASGTKYTPTDVGLPNENDPDGPFLYGDHALISTHILANTLKKTRETVGNVAYSNLTVLDKFNWEIPRFYKNNQVLVLDSQNSTIDFRDPASRTDTIESCQFVFKDTLNLKAVTSLASGSYENVLELTCHMFPTNDDTSIGYRVYYYAKDIGEIHRITSLGQGTVHHVVTSKRLIDIN